MKKLIIILIMISVAALWSEDIFKAKVYRLDSNKQELLFDHYNTVQQEGEKTILTHFYSRPDSSIATIDEVILENGEFKSSKSQFLEVDEIGSVIRNSDKMTMRFEKDGKVKEKELNYPTDLLVGPMFNDHIIENWEALNSDEKIYFKLPAPNIQKIATFTFQEVNNSGYEKPDHIVFKLNAASIFLKLVVRPSYFVYEVATKRLMEIHGTTILRTKQNGKWQNSTDVNMYYEYEGQNE
ncbi:MAG: hypothetical protein P9L97_10270 [Candidatus Tenebribacter davisii]|nr:hypothetical protein [Candidatus Tenebribacter davisii]